MTKYSYSRVAALGLTFALGLAGGISASAQSKSKDKEKDAPLQKEITIEREIVPELRAAQRLNIYPQVMSPGFEPRTLRFTDYTRASAISPVAAPFEPALTAAAAPLTPYRGYFDAGWFPLANVGAAAGYQLVAEENTQMGVWLNFNRWNYKPQALWEPSPLYPVLAQLPGNKDNLSCTDFSAGLNLTTNVAKAGTLALGADVAVSAYVPVMCQPFTTGYDSQTALRWNFNADWQGRFAQRGTYHLGLKTGMFNYSKAPYLSEDFEPSSFRFKPQHEMTFGINGGFFAPVGSRTAFGLDARVDMAHYNSFMADIAQGGVVWWQPSWEYERQQKGRTMTVLAATPYFRVGTEQYFARLGVEVDYAFNSWNTVNLSPSMLFSAQVDPRFGATLQLSGGERLNPLARLFELSRYATPMGAYYPSRVPVRADLTLRVGPFMGASAELFGRFANARHWLMPRVGCANVFVPENMDAVMIGGRLRAAYRQWVAVEASLSYRLGNDGDHCWYEWADRARMVIDANITSQPIDRLEVSLGAEIRAKRFTNGYIEGTEWNPDEPGSVTSESRTQLDELGTWVNLHAGGTYKLRPNLSVFLRVDNLLSRRNYMLFGVQAQRINGLIGIAAKF